MRCSLCFRTLRQTKYDLAYIGLVCSTCFRISKRRYIELVDTIAERNLEYINLELLSITMRTREKPQAIL